MKFLTILTLLATVGLSEQRLIEDGWRVTVSYGLTKSDQSMFLNLARNALQG